MDDNVSAFNSHEYNAKIRKTIPYYDEFYKQIISVVKAKTEKPLCWLDANCIDMIQSHRGFSLRKAA